MRLQNGDIKVGVLCADAEVGYAARLIADLHSALAAPVHNTAVQQEQFDFLHAVREQKQLYFGILTSTAGKYRPNQIRIEAGKQLHHFSCTCSQMSQTRRLL